jgi:hypothetical protein
MAIAAHLFLDARTDTKISAFVQVPRFYNANFVQFYVTQIMYKVVITFNKMVSLASFLTSQFPTAKWATHENLLQPQSSRLGNANSTVPTGTPSVLPPSFPPAKVPTTLLRWFDLRGLLWTGVYHCNDLSMQSSTILLESENPWRPLHPKCSILDLLRSDQHHYRFLYPVLADAYTLLAVVVEEE